MVKNWARGVVTTGGTTTLSISLFSADFPRIQDVVAINEEFVVGFTKSNGAPLATGVGKITAVVSGVATFEWVRVDETFVNGVLDNTSPTTPEIPVSTVLHTPFTEQTYDAIISALAGKATSAQGALADSAIQPEDLGSAAYQNSSAFATAAQGALAESALQPEDIGVTVQPFNADTALVSTAKVIDYNDLGDISASTLTLDIRKKFNIGRLTGSGTSLTINGVSPEVGLIEPAHFTIVNNGSVTKTVIFNSNLFSIAGSTLSQVTLPIDNKIDFDVRRNPLNASVSYEVKVGDVNYNQTASGTDTRWNTSNRASDITLTNNDYTAEMTTPSASRRSVKAFGFKSTGKWSFAFYCEQGLIGGSSSGIESSLYVVNSSLLVTGDPFVSGMQYGGFFSGRNGNTSLNYVFGRTSANINAPESTPTATSIIEICVDLSTGRGWVCYNSTWLGGGNPETNTAPSFTFIPGQEMAITWTTVESGLNPSSGIWRILTQLEKPNRHLYPSFPNWTA